MQHNCIAIYFKLYVSSIRSIGRLARSTAESNPKANTEEHTIKVALAAGELIPKLAIDRMVERQLLQLSQQRGIIIDGMPRDQQQLDDFEHKVRAAVRALRSSFRFSHAHAIVRLSFH